MQWMKAFINAAASLILLVGLAACDDNSTASAAQFGGDTGHGRALIMSLGCGSCHSIPGIPGANGLVGPPLDNIGDRTILAGVLPNTPNNMIAWLKAPQSVIPGNAMPNMELNDDGARDIAAYLYTLR
jgi:cytochrome c1